MTGLWAEKVTCAESGTQLHLSCDCWDLSSTELLQSGFTEGCNSVGLMGPFVSCLFRSGEKLTDEVDKAGDRAPSQLISLLRVGSFMNFSFKVLEITSPLLRWIESGGRSTGADTGGLQWFSVELTLVFGKAGVVHTGLVLTPFTTEDDDTTVVGRIKSWQMLLMEGIDCISANFSASLIA